MTKLDYDAILGPTGHGGAKDPPGTEIHFTPFYAKADPTWTAATYGTDPIPVPDYDNDLDDREPVDDEHESYIPYSESGTLDKIKLHKLLYGNLLDLLAFALNNEPGRGVNRETAQVKLTNACLKLKDVLIENGYEMTPGVINEVNAIVNRLYEQPLGCKYISLYLNNRELIFKILSTCSRKGIIIDSEAKRLGDLDFSELYLNCRGVSLMYIPHERELLVISNNCPLSDSRGLSLDYGLFETVTSGMPDLDIVSNEETIEINGKKYSKSLVESALECDIQTFLDNLELDSYTAEPIDNKLL